MSWSGVVGVIKKEMVSRNRALAILVSLLLIASMVLAACGSTPEPEPILQTVEVEGTQDIEKEGSGAAVTETRITEKEAAAPAVPGEPTEVPPPELPIYRMGVFEDFTTTNYWAYLDQDTTVWNSYLLRPRGYPCFWTLAYPDMLFVPFMATDMPQPLEQEGETWVQTIEIRSGVTWSDGVEVTVHDFVFTGETVRDLALGGNWLTSFDFDYIDHFEAVDDHTVKIYYSQEPGLSVSQVGGVGFAPWMPKHFWEEKVAAAAESDQPAMALYAEDGSASPSMGAFTFTRWEPGAFAELTAREDAFFNNSTSVFYSNGAYKQGNDNYEFCVWGACRGDVKLEYTEGPYVSTVIYTIYGTQDAAVLAMANGEVDFLLNPLGLQRGLREQVVGNPDLGAFQNPSNGMRYLAFNMRKSPNDSLEFRQAVATLIDKEYLTGKVLQNTAIAIYGMVPESNAAWFNPDAPTIGKGLSREERVAQAKELLTAGGFGWDVKPEFDAEKSVVVPGSTLKDPDGNELAEIELLVPSASYDPMRATAAVWIAQWMNEVGIPVKTNFTDFNTIIPLVMDPDPETGEIEFDWYILGWGLGNPALPEFHDAFFACANDAKDGGFNTPGYCSEEFDALAASFRSAKSLEEAREAVWAMDALLAHDLPYVTLFTAPILEFYAKARVDYPFIEVLDGLQSLSGLPALVMHE